MKDVILFTNGVQVKVDKDGFICLTDLWEASGRLNKKDPSNWQKRESTIEFIDFVSATLAENHNSPKQGSLKKNQLQVLNATPSCIIKSKRGKGGGTYAHKQVALAYAKYLSSKLHYEVNQAYFERLEEEKNPSLSLERGINNYKKQGKEDSWISARFDGIVSRKHLTSTLALHGVNTPNGYRDCTNAIYAPMYGGGANLIREKKGLRKSDKTREHMGELELAGLRLAELAAADNIKRKNLQGHKQCEYECYSSSKTVAQAISKIKNS